MKKAWVLLSLVGTVALGEEAAVELSLRADKAEYLVGEPVTLTLEVANSSAGPVHGFLSLEPMRQVSFPFGTLSYCDRTGCNEYVPKALAIFTHITIKDPTVQLEPGGKKQSWYRIALDETKGRFILIEPGECELRWTAGGIFEGPGLRWDRSAKALALTASVKVKVLPVPPSEEEAFAAYRSGSLGQVAAYMRNRTVVDDQLVRALVSFLRRFPTSVYADSMREGAVSALMDLAEVGKVGPDDLEFVREYLSRRGAHE